MDFANQYKNRSVLVTGHTGFKGSWLSLWLHKLGARVHGYALNPPTTPSNYDVSKVGELLEKEYLKDIRDSESLCSAIQTAQPEVIFHLAAQPLVLDSYARPHETFDVNIMGTSNLLSAVKQYDKECVVIVVTSDKCYQNDEQDWGYRESDRMGGHDPYSASKGASELITSSYRDSFFPADDVAQHGVKLASVRAGNVIGGGDWAKDRIITDIVDSLINQKEILVRRPKAIRPWQHVLEPLSGYLTLASQMLQCDDAKWCSGWNFGPHSNQAVNVQSLVETFIESWGDGHWLSPEDKNSLVESRTLRLCIDKAISHLKWQPVWDVQQAVEKTVRWYQAFRHSTSQNNFDLCSQQIQEFENDFLELQPSTSTSKISLDLPFKKIA
ncbi:MAG: CDP-glucose 4,6-dehydratase [Pirellulales bacterium]